MRKSLVIAALLAVTLSPMAYADGFHWNWLSQYKKPNLHWGQMELHPYYALSETYDSNIYLVPPDQPAPNGQVGGGVRSSWITKNNLGLEGKLPIHRLHTLTYGYDFEAQNYSTQPDINDTINQRVHADYAYAGAYGVTFRTGDQYINTTDQAFSELIQRNRRWANHLYSSVDYAPERTRLTAGADISDTMNKYLDPAFAQQLNRYNLLFGANVGYRLQPKTRAYLAYHREIIHYTVDRELPNQDKNNKSHHFDAGLTGVIAPKVEGRVQGGLIYREYDEAPIGGTTRITHNFGVDTTLVYRPQDRTTVTLDLSRRLEESIDGANRFFIANELTLDIKHKLPRKFSVGGMAAMAVDKYSESQVTTAAGTAQGSRRDDIYQIGAWISYDIQEWLVVGLSDIYRERNSTFTAQFNYEDQQTALSLALKF